jgi:hypothetical protein
MPFNFWFRASSLPVVDFISAPLVGAKGSSFFLASGSPLDLYIFYRHTYDVFRAECRFCILCLVFISIECKELG